jgi:hypothetical protein
VAPEVDRLKLLEGLSRNVRQALGGDQIAQARGMRMSGVP